MRHRRLDPTRAIIEPAMRFNYPKSFLSLLVVGFAIVAVPLILGLITNAYSLEKLAEQSRQAVQQAVHITQSSRALASLIPTLERNARQFAVTSDTAFFDAYRGSRQSFASLAQQMATSPLNDGQRKLLTELRKREAAAYEDLSQQRSDQAMHERMRAQFGDLATTADALTQLSNDLIDQEVAALREQALKARNRTYWQILAMVPAAILLIAGFTFLLSQPIRQLDRSIRRLGDGQFNRAIKVEGPQDMVKLGEQLEWLRRRLLELEQQKTRFLQHISHELKTPLTALREGSDLLSTEVAGQLNDEQREIAQILQANSHELRRLIEDLINYSAVHAQTFYVDLTITQLRDVVLRVAKTHKLALLPKKLKLKLNCEKVTAYVDEEKLRVIVDNLLSNAIKYSPNAGSITIKLFKDAQSVVLEVSDEGPGIPKAERAKVFDPFYRGEEPERAPLKGTGLGLSIVLEYVKLHHGTITIFDPPLDPPARPRGAHFRVTLPRKRVTGAGQSLEQVA
jgi:two-component system, NtrC family, sensor histidine kinase GlrK